MYKIATMLHDEQVDFVDNQFDKIIEERASEIVSTLKGKGYIYIHSATSTNVVAHQKKLNVDNVYIFCNVLIDGKLEKMLFDHININRHKHNDIFFVMNSLTDGTLGNFIFMKLSGE